MLNRLKKHLNGLNGKAGFTLIELMVVLVIIGTILMFAVDEYVRYMAEARVTRAKADLNEFAQAIRLHNIREEKAFDVSIFSPEYLKSFVGTYLEKEPPLDPWGNVYLHDSDQGVVYSKGPNGLDDIRKVATETDDILVRYLPETLFMTRAEYFDSNLNNIADYGDYIEVRFSRPANIKDATAVDFRTSNPEKALGSAFIQKTKDPSRLRIVFSPPVMPQLIPGETTIYPRDFIDSIVDYSPEEKPLIKSEEILIKKRKK